MPLLLFSIFSLIRSSLLSFPGRGRGGLRGGRLRGGRERHHHRGPHAHAHKQELQQLGEAPNSAAIEGGVFVCFFSFQLVALGVADIALIVTVVVDMSIIQVRKGVCDIAF